MPDAFGLYLILTDPVMGYEACASAAVSQGVRYLQLRMKNQFLIDKSDGLLVVYDEERPGNPQYMIEMAKRKAAEQPYPIFTIDDYELQLVVEEEQFNGQHDW